MALGDKSQTRREVPRTALRMKFPSEPPIAESA